MAKTFVRTIKRHELIGNLRQLAAMAGKELTIRNTHAGTRLICGERSLKLGSKREFYRPRQIAARLGLGE